jgi:hypothetical protein
MYTEQKHIEEIMSVRPNVCSFTFDNCEQISMKFGVIELDQILL